MRGKPPDVDLGCAGPKLVPVRTQRQISSAHACSSVMPTMASSGMEYTTRGGSVSTSPSNAIPNALQAAARACSMDVLAAC